MLDRFNQYLHENTKLESTEIQYIGKYFSPFSAKRNEILVNDFEICNYFYFINSGILRIFTMNQEGMEISRFFAFDNMFCTALPSFIDKKPAGEYLQCIEKAQLLVCNRIDFYDLINQFSELDRVYRKILELGFITSQKRIYSFQGFDAIEKVRWTIQNQPKILLRVSNKMAASYLGISPSTLSRVKAKL